MNVILVCVWECHLYNGESFHLINLVSPPPPSLLSPRHSCLFLLCSIITPLSLHRRRRRRLLRCSVYHRMGCCLGPATTSSSLSYHTTCIRALSLPVSPNHNARTRFTEKRTRGVLLLLGGVTIRTLQNTLTRFALFYERGD